jgi:hypothetical protein
MKDARRKYLYNSKEIHITARDIYVNVVYSTLQEHSLCPFMPILNFHSLVSVLLWVEQKCEVTFLLGVFKYNFNYRSSAACFEMNGQFSVSDISSSSHDYLQTDTTSPYICH